MVGTATANPAKPGINAFRLKGEDPKKPQLPRRGVQTVYEPADRNVHPVFVDGIDVLSELVVSFFSHIVSAFRDDGTGCEKGEYLLTYLVLKEGRISRWTDR